MKIFSGSVVLLIVLTLLFAPTAFGADAPKAKNTETAKKTPTVSDDSWISNGEELGNWWVKNPKKYDPVPRPLLYHIEGSYSYSELGGNIEVKNHKGELELALRKDLFTSITNYAISRSDTDITLSGVSTSVESDYFRQKFRYGLTDWMEAGAGVIWNITDTAKYLENRLIYYGGVRFTVLDFPSLMIKMGGYYGFSDTEFMNDKITGMRKYADFQPVDDYDSDALYFGQMLKWKISKTVTFSENADYMLLLKDTEYYSWMLKLALNFRLTKHSSFFASYIINYDNNPFVEAVQDYLDGRRAAGDNVGDMETTDTVLAVGVKFSF